MSQSRLPTLILRADRQRGGDLWVQLRLSDGRAGWVYLPAGELASSELDDVDAVLLHRLATPASVRVQAPGVPER